jgi:putative pre-16S rRNA nuclease
VYATRVRVLGVDYGRRRIGLALSDATGLIATPWKTIAGTGRADQVAVALAAEIDALYRDADGLECVVLGWPRTLGGTANAMTPMVEALARALEARIPVPVVLQDERLTSREAESRLAVRERDWRRRKATLDAASAAIILQDFLDNRPRPEAPEVEADSR